MFADRGLKEAEQTRVDLVEEEPEIVARMLSFLYTRHYDDAKIPEWASKLLFDNCGSAANVLEKRIEKADDFPANKMKSPSDTDATSGESHAEADSESGQSGSLAPQPRTLLLPMEVNTLMYACGDEFGILPLKIAATSKFEKCLSEDSKSAHFRRAVELVLEKTAPDDLEIRYSLIVWCMKNRGSIDSSITDLIIEFEPLSYKLFLEMKHELDEQKLEIGTKESELEHSQVEIDRLRRKVDAAEEQEEAIDSFVSTYSDTKFCKSCGTKNGGFDVNVTSKGGFLSDSIKEIICKCSTCGKEAGDR